MELSKAAARSSQAEPLEVKSREVAPWEGTFPSFLYNPQPQIAGQKRRHSSHSTFTNTSWSTSPHSNGYKRRRSSAPLGEQPGALEEADYTDTANTPRAKVWQCPDCDRPCWNCIAASDAQQPTTTEAPNPQRRQDWSAASCGKLVPGCSTCTQPCWTCYTVKKAAINANEQAWEGSLSESESMDPPSRPASAASTTQTSNKKRKQYQERGLTYISPREPGFTDHILRPCGLIVDPRKPFHLNPTQTFGQQASPTHKSRVFIHADDAYLEGMIEDFTEYQARAYDEHTLTTVCQDSIVLRDRFIYADMLEEGSSTTTISVRRDKWKPRREGPSVTGITYTYDWDLEPDTTYAVSINMFEAEQRRTLQLREPWLADRSSVCPYLTIEYKCSSKAGKSSDAKAQIAAASMIWLYQRKRVRDALDQALDDLRHYSITFLDDHYTINETHFKRGFYEIRSLAAGILTEMDGLKAYIEWSNAIHSWGLGPNAESFKHDMKKLLEREQGTQALPSPLSTDSLAASTNRRRPEA